MRGEAKSRWVVVALVALSASLPSFAGAPRSSPASVAGQVTARILARINSERSEFGLKPVKLDPLASAVADTFCARQLIDRSVGHFATDGLAPYQRYSFAGGNDGLTENTAAWSSEKPYTAGEIAGLVDRSIEAMMGEAPPDDGHRRAILDRWATHVGIGLAWQGGEVRIAQEFVRRYIDWTSAPPRDAKAGARVRCSGVPKTGWEIAAASVHYEPFPHPISRAEANRIDNYELPPRRADYRAQRIDSESEIVRLAQQSGGSPGDLIVRGDRSFTFSVPFSDGPGVYTLVIWVRQTGQDEPLVAASNVSIRVAAETPDTVTGPARR